MTEAVTGRGVGQMLVYLFLRDRGVHSARAEYLAARSCPSGAEVPNGFYEFVERIENLDG